MLDKVKSDRGNDLNNLTVGQLADKISAELNVSREDVKEYINKWHLIQHGIPEENIKYISGGMPVAS